MIPGQGIATRGRGAPRYSRTIPGIFWIQLGTYLLPAAGTFMARRAQRRPPMTDNAYIKLSHHHHTVS